MASYFKQQAKLHLSGKYGEFIGMSILLAVIGFGVQIIPLIGSLAAWMFTGVFIFGYTSIAMAVVEGRAPALSDAFSGFHLLEKSIVAGILVQIYLTLWSLLIIPAFIKPWSYAATFYLLRRYPNLGANEAITRSRRLMKGHKWEAFCLSLSFIGWVLLAIPTCGLLYLYVGPYMGTTFALFYNKLMDDEAAQLAQPTLESAAGA